MYICSAKYAVFAQQKANIYLFKWFVEGKKNVTSSQLEFLGKKHNINAPLGLHCKYLFGSYPHLWPYLKCQKGHQARNL